MTSIPDDPQSNLPPVKERVEAWLDGNDGENDGGNDGAALSLQDCSRPESSELARQLLMHSLLVGHFESSASRETRIQATLDAFEKQNALVSESSTASITSRSTNLLTRKRLVLIATTAATILLALGGWGLFGPPNAEAALSRVLAATRLPVTRVYEAKIYRQVLGRRVIRDAILYSESVNLFAAEFQEKNRRSSVWIGFDGDRRWLLSENYQWKSTDDGDLWSDELFERMTSKNLYYNGILTELPDSFDVRLLPTETIVIGGLSFECQPIEATPRDPAKGYPDAIHIWPHPQSGVILQMHLIVNNDRPFSVRRIELQFLREQEVPDEFFTLNFHQPK